MAQFIIDVIVTAAACIAAALHIGVVLFTINEGE